MRDHRMPWTKILLGVALLALAASAAAQTPPFTPDRVDLAAAKKEGTVTWYTSTPVEVAQKIANLFQQETGIRVELFRSGGSAVLRRFLQEIDARRVVADVLTVSDPAAAGALIKRDLFVPFRPRNFDKVRDEVKDPKGYHIAQRLNLVGIIARTDKGLELPRTWTDLTSPRFKGLMVMPDPSYTAIQLMVVGTLSQKYGWEFYQKLRANEIMIVQGHQQVSGNAHARRTLYRGRRRRPVRLGRPQGGAQGPDHLSHRRSLCHSGADRDHQGRAAPQRGQGPRRIHDRRHRAEALSRRGNLCGALGRRAASGQPPACPDQAHGRRLRPDREGREDPQGPLQRDLSVDGQRRPIRRTRSCQRGSERRSPSPAWTTARSNGDT